jgi:hypothetical protein
LSESFSWRYRRLKAAPAIAILHLPTQKPDKSGGFHFDETPHWSDKARLVGITHVALEVWSIEQTLAFYGRLFEFSLRGRSAKM